MDGLETLPAAQRDRIHEAIRAETLEVIETSLGLRWIPLSLHMEVLERTRDELGSAAYREFWRDRTAASLERPLLFGKVARTALRRFTGDALGFLKMVPSTFRYMVRDAGEMSADVTPGHARLRLDGFPRAHATEAWADGWVGALSAVTYRLMGHDLAVTVEEHDVGRGRFVWAIARPA